MPGEKQSFDARGSHLLVRTGLAESLDLRPCSDYRVTLGRMPQ